MSERLKKAIKNFQKNPKGGMRQAMLKAGFSQNYADNPKQLTSTKTYQKFLENAGITDQILAEKQAALINAAHITSQRFPAVMKSVVVTHNEAGKKLRKPTETTEWSHVSDARIKELIESVPAHVLLYIQKSVDEKIAYFRVPDTVVQTKHIEMGLKIKGHFAPEKHEITLPKPTEEEEQMLDNILGNNKA